MGTLSAAEIEKYLPHRGRMRLVEKVIHIDGQTAITSSRVLLTWPRYTADAIHPVLLTELTAQTAGIHNEWLESQRFDSDGLFGGWLVGIRDADFHVGCIAVGTEIVVTTTNAYVMEGYREVLGTVDIDGKPAARIRLQLMQAEQ